MKNSIAYLSAFILVLVSACGDADLSSPDSMVAEAKKEVKLLSPAEINDILMGEELYNLVDVREHIEYYYGFIPGSICIPRGQLEFSINNPEFWENEGLYVPQKSEIFVLYCKKGSRSVLAAQTLQKMGYERVYVIDGGWKAWELAYPDYTDKDLDKLGGGDSHEEVGGC